MDSETRMVLFDLDGTLVSPTSGRTFRANPTDWSFLPRRQEVVRDLIERGVRLGIATNQGGVAHGIFDPDEIWEAVVAAARELGISDARCRICFHHPTGKIPLYGRDCVNRKPNPGMLTSLFQWARLDGMPDLLPEQVLCVGDREEDQKAAETAGYRFAWADDFFREGAGEDGQ